MTDISKAYCAMRDEEMRIKKQKKKQEKIIKKERIERIEKLTERIERIEKILKISEIDNKFSIFQKEIEEKFKIKK